jgi:glycosyltransferase involved in cell wall biosynthesis
MKSRQGFREYLLLAPMKKVLILAYDFPPNTSVGGQRPYSWLKYFHRYGYYPIVVTRHWDEGLKTPEDMIRSSAVRDVTDTVTDTGRLIRVPYTSNLRDRLIILQGKNHFSLFRKLISFCNYLGQYFTFSLDPSAAIYREAKKIAATEKIDLIIATGKPFVLFRYAYILNKKFSIPWIADYRDGWADSYNRKNDTLFNRLLNKTELCLERKFTKNITCLTTVTPFLAKKISETVCKPGHLILNGADVSLYANKKEQNNIFTVSYTGILYNFPYMKMFEDAFKLFIATYPEKDKIFLFVGIDLQKNPSFDTVYRLAQQYPDYIKILPRVDVQTAADLHQQSHVLLNFIPRNEYMVMPVKTFGYAAARRPAIVVETIPNDDVFFMPDRDIQYFARNAGQMYKLFEKFYMTYKSGKEVITSITNEEIQSFSRESRARQYAELIDTYLSLNDTGI